MRLAIQGMDVVGMDKKHWVRMKKDAYVSANFAASSFFKKRRPRLKFYAFKHDSSAASFLLVIGKHGR